jgi:hypothetical protein
MLFSRRSFFLAFLIAALWLASTTGLIAQSTNSLILRTSYTDVPVGFQVGFWGLSPDFPVASDDISTNRWDFGDGTVVSNATSVSHSWMTVGNYAVVFTAYSTNRAAWLTATQNVQVTPAAPVACSFSLAGSNQITFSWTGNAVLLEAASLECPAWFRVADAPGTFDMSTLDFIAGTSAGSRFFKLVSLPPADQLEAAFSNDLNACRVGESTKPCEHCVTAYLLSAPILYLDRIDVSELGEAGEASAIGTALGSCVSPQQQSILRSLQTRLFGP